MFEGLERVRKSIKGTPTFESGRCWIVVLILLVVVVCDEMMEGLRGECLTVHIAVCDN